MRRPVAHAAVVGSGLFLSAFYRANSQDIVAWCSCGIIAGGIISTISSVIAAVRLKRSRQPIAGFVIVAIASIVAILSMIGIGCSVYLVCIEAVRNSLMAIMAVIVMSLFLFIGFHILGKSDKRYKYILTAWVAFAIVTILWVISICIIDPYYSYDYKDLWDYHNYNGVMVSLITVSGLYLHIPMAGILLAQYHLLSF